MRAMTALLIWAEEITVIRDALNQMPGDDPVLLSLRSRLETAYRNKVLGEAPEPKVKPAPVSMKKAGKKPTTKDTP